MRIFFSGIGGTGIGPLALIAKQAGYEVSGSDKQNSQYIEYLKDHGIPDIYIGQTTENITKHHQAKHIDWYVYSSAVEKENPNHPELIYVDQNNIKKSKRDELLNYILEEKKLDLLAVAGTHGKTTTTAMLIYLLKSLATPLSYSVGAKISFGEMGHFTPDAKLFALEADEFDRNFLSFSPYMAIISGISYDHHEIYPTQESYNQAFIDFLSKSQFKIIWRSDLDKLNIETDSSYTILDDNDPNIAKINLPGLVNKRDAWLVCVAVSRLIGKDPSLLGTIMSKFPGVSRRMEQIADNLYSDYAHTTDKIIGAIDIAQEIANNKQSQLVVIYEPLTNRRMHHTIKDHYNIFEGVNKLYWVPSYLAREDPNQHVLSPDELIAQISPTAQSKAESAIFDDNLKSKIIQHLQNGDIVLALSGGGGGSLDEWLREKLSVISRST